MPEVHGEILRGRVRNGNRGVYFSLFSSDWLLSGILIGERVNNILPLCYSNPEPSFQMTDPLFRFCFDFKWISICSTPLKLDCLFHKDQWNSNLFFICSISLFRYKICFTSSSTAIKTLFQSRRFLPRCTSQFQKSNHDLVLLLWLLGIPHTWPP